MPRSASECPGVPLSASDVRQVEAFAAALRERFSRLHILINNAAQTLTRSNGWCLHTHTPRSVMCGVDQWQRCDGAQPRYKFTAAPDPWYGVMDGVMDSMVWSDGRTDGRTVVNGDGSLTVCPMLYRHGIYHYAICHMSYGIMSCGIMSYVTC